jgi:hypothetical protein
VADPRGAIIERMIEREVRVLLAAADLLDAQAAQAPPGRWREVTRADGVVTIVDATGIPVLELTGPWVAGTAQYLTVVSPPAAASLGRILRASAVELRRRTPTLPPQIRHALLSVAREVTHEPPKNRIIGPWR